MPSSSSRQEASCPSASGIAAFWAGALGASSVDVFEQHLDRCNRCMAAVAVGAGSSADAGVEGQTRRPPVFETGEQLAGGRYRIAAFLGRGGMGEVYEAIDALLNRRIALKTLHPRLIGGLAALDRLKTEVALALRVSHPNVCRVFDLGVADLRPEASTVPYLTMEMLPGATLRTHLERLGRLPWHEASHLLVQIAAGLAAAHEAGVVHRDLKGSNVILVADGFRHRAVITDFGLAAQPGHAGTQGDHRQQFVGTPAYAAPEQIAGDPATPATDVYSFGLLAFEVLVGPEVSRAERARTGGGPESFARALKERAPEMPLRARRLICRMLARAPTQRPADARRVHQQLARIVGPIAHRRRVLAVVAAGLLFASLGVAAISAAHVSSSLPAARVAPVAAAVIDAADGARRQHTEKGTSPSQAPSATFEVSTTNVPRAARVTGRRRRDTRGAVPSVLQAVRAPASTDIIRELEWRVHVPPDLEDPFAVPPSPDAQP
jgi:hypothetical protein